MMLPLCGKVRYIIIVADAAQLKISENKAETKSQPLDFEEIIAPSSNSIKDAKSRDSNCLDSGPDFRKSWFSLNFEPRALWKR